MRRLSWAVLFSVLMVGRAGAADPAPSDGYVYEVQRVADHVHLIYRPDALRIPAEGNVEVIEQADGLVVVDAGGSPVGGKRIVDKIRTISPKPVKLLIYTHWHGDHNLGASAFRAAYPGLRILSTPGTRAAMTGPPMDYLKQLTAQGTPMRALGERMAQNTALDADTRRRWAETARDAPEIEKAYAGVVVTPADETFDRRLDLADRAAPAQVLFLGRANTDGDAVVWLPRQRVLITGDIVVSPYPYGTDSYPAEWIQVLKQLKAYDFQALVPGHGEVEHDRRYLDQLIGLIEAVRAKVGPLARDGVALDQVKAKVDLTAETAPFVGGSDWIRLFMKQFFVTPMIENAYKEARGEPIVQT